MLRASLRPLLLCAALAPGARCAVDFNRDVRPILSDKCFACHGPDANKRKAELRLDIAEKAYAPAESGERAIVPGNLEASELLKRITSKDADDLMPPPKEHKKLSTPEVETLRQWIAEGGKYDLHWAFKPVAPKPVPPGVAGGNMVDAFVRARLQSTGLTPAPEEEKARLIRRLTVDLTGLPPLISEVEAFVGDHSPETYERVVDRLLASPHFGERMAVPWLDLARFSDTGGYHNDSTRDVWMYRDWVVKAFNSNMPFDQFTVEQLAGDLLPDATVDQKIASGFMRNVMTSDEGGIIDAEYLNLYVVDRVSTFGATWLGLTVNCAQCHDHKYDPITTRDYYRLYAFFHNVPEKVKDGTRDRNPEPRMLVPTPDQEKEFARLDGEIAAADKTLKELATGLDATQTEWEKTILASGKAEEPKGPWTKFALDADGNGVTDTGETIAGKVEGAGTFVEGSVGNSFRIVANGYVDLGERFGFEKDQPFTAAAWLRLKPQGGAPFGKMEKAPDYRGWDVEVSNNRAHVHLIHKWPERAIHLEAEKDLPPDVFTHVTVTYDGSGEAAGVAMYVNGQPVKLKVHRDNLDGTLKTTAPFAIGRRGGGDSPFTGRVDDLRIYDRALNPSEAANLGGSATLALVGIPAEQRTPEQKEQLKKFYRQNFASDYSAAERLLADLRKTRTDLEKQIPNVMVMAEMEKPRETFIKVRGNYEKNGEKVTAATPAFLPTLPAQPINGQRYTRLDLARWLVSPDNPLTARVAVNRWWAMLFGTGLVKTVNDFGMQGEWPTHPDLLDSLAADFSRDWNVKRAIKQMVMSATYRQSSKVKPMHLEKDTDNRLLARGPRHRLDAEFVRDNALALSGLLNREIGGKPVLPYQPPGIWEINEMSGLSWKHQHDAGEYRRALYIYHRRSTPYPSLLTFDAPNREVCTAGRARTSTPLQSLVLMNDPVYVEAARALAIRVLREGGFTDEQRINYTWRLALGRSPTAAETCILQRTLEQQLATYRQDKAAAEALLKTGDLKNPANAEVNELAAWTAVANVVLNLNETISN
jgi:hypothetical protein